MPYMFSQELYNTHIPDVSISHRGPVVHVKLVPSAGIQPDAETSTWQLHVHLLVLDLPGCSLSVFLEVEMISKQKFFHRF